MTPQRADRIDGAHAVYHYLQKELLEQDVWLFQLVAARLALGLGIWFAPETYAQCPFLKPYARRDPTARGDRRAGIPDRWGSPDESALFRDDNSLIKQLPYSLPIRGGANHRYSRKRADRGFVCAHVWRHLADGTPAARDWRTYSFVPNLVWLPEQVAKLTDRPGSFLQTYLQAVSWRLFRDAPVSNSLRPYVEEAWGILAEPVGVPLQSLPDPESVNSFEPAPSFCRRRANELSAIVIALDSVIRGTPIAQNRAVSTRYREGLPSVRPRVLRRRHDLLAGYLTAVRESLPTSQ